MTSELAGLGTFFIGVGGLIFFSMAAYWFYQLIRFIKTDADKEERYNLFEQIALDKFGKTKGVETERELVKRSVIRRKTFRKKLEEEVIKDFFGKEKEE